MNIKAIFLIGPPGSGKGTQAELLAKHLGFFHFEISKIIEEKFKNADPNDKEINEEKEKRLAGGLVEPKLVARWFFEKIEKLKNTVSGFVFSGSGRTMYEVENQVPYLEKLYGKENIIAVEIKLSEEESIKRNSTRRICKANRHPIPNFPEFASITNCPQDGSEIVTRELDKPDIIKQRYQVYLSETVPVLDYFKNNGYRVVEINGEQGIDEVFEDIKANLQNS